MGADSNHPSPNLNVRIVRLDPMRVARFHAFGPHPEQEAWAAELAATSNAIVKLDTVALHAINADFAGRVPELERDVTGLKMIEKLAGLMYENGQGRR